MIQVTIEHQELDALISRAAKLHDRMPKIIAQAGTNTVKTHFHQLNRQRSSRSGYYARAADRTFPVVAGGRIGVSVDHEGVALHRFGGTVRPRRAKYLTIPVADAAHGKRVREFNGVTFRVNKRTGKGVVLQGNRVLFALTKKAEFNADASVLPTDEQLRDDITRIVDFEIERGTE